MNRHLQLYPFSRILFADREFTYHEQMPIILIVSWVNGIPMDLNLNLLETGSLVMTVFTTAFTLQVTVTIARIKEIWIGSEAPIFCEKPSGPLLGLIVMSH
jgi:hypothetical protein